MRKYQLILVLKTSLSEGERKKVLDSVKSFLKEVKIAKEDIWGQKSLAYSIKREMTGFYVSYLLETKEPISLDLEKKLTVNEDVLRHLLLRKD